MNNTKKIELQSIVEIGIFLFALLGSIIPLHIHLDNKMEKGFEQSRIELRQSRKETNQLIEAIRGDVRDFHNRLIIIEERNKGR